MASAYAGREVSLPSLFVYLMTHNMVSLFPGCPGLSQFLPVVSPVKMDNVAFTCNGQPCLLSYVF